jgi:hypothetical protein
MKKTIRTLAWAITLLMLFSGQCAWAIPFAEVTYLESDLGAGTWEYEFTVFNTSSLEDYLGNIFAVTLDLGVVTGLNNITKVSLPEDWDYFAYVGGELDPSYIDNQSLLFGAPPEGTDIAPGNALGGFVFQFDQKLNAIDFIATFGQVDSSGIPIAPPTLEEFGTATPVPEPSTFLLLASSLTGLAFFGRKKFSKIEQKKSTQ